MVTSNPIYIMFQIFFLKTYKIKHKNRLFSINYIRFFGLIGILLSQEIPQDYHKYKLDRFIIDYENNFANLSTFGPIRYKKNINKVF